MYKIDFKKPSYVYFVGIGGISMSGLAEILANEGFRVAGSDWNRSETTESLEKKGIKVFYGEQRYENITDDIDCVVFTSAVHKDNPEYVATMDKGLHYLYRAELLGQLMQNYKTPIAISGTHGKTTTTSMISEILLDGDLDPTLSIGGMFRRAGGNYRIGRHDYFVAEACEYTNSFLSLYTKIGLILNIEEDHLDFFKDLDDIRKSFKKFAELVPSDGFLIINGEIPSFREITHDLACRVITYSTQKFCTDGSTASYYADNINLNSLNPSFLLHTPDGRELEITLSVPGMHNVSNAIAAFACADLIGLESGTIVSALHSFTGTDRRFEQKGQMNGVTIIDDYAHHPSEITATLKACANFSHKTLWCAFQPHTYSRTKALLKDFARALSLADKVVLADIYAARETDTLGISSKDLKKEIEALGRECYYFPSFAEIENFLEKNCINGDLLITMGAGNVHEIGEDLLKK